MSHPTFTNQLRKTTCRIQLVALYITGYSGQPVSLSPGKSFASQPGHTKEHHKNGTDGLPAWHACIRVGVWQCSLTA